jgi:glycosyltransferase involved in cell wall biosynthesis
MITVLLPVSAVDEFLPIAINSIQNQTFKDFVCHILCKQLTEDDLKRLSELVSSDDRFVLHHLHLNGIAFALNYGLNLVETKYVARMDSDDINSHPTRFEKQLNFLEANPNYVMVGCRVMLVNECGETIKQKFKFFESDQEIRRALKYRMPLCHPAMMIRADTLFAHSGYMYGNTAEDHELYLRIARNPNNLFRNLPDHLFSYRRHGKQLTHTRNAQKAYSNIGGFLFTEFLRTWNPLYLIGIVASHPLMRKVRHVMRKVKR